MGKCKLPQIDQSLLRHNHLSSYNPFQSSLLSSQNITGKQNQTTKHNLPIRYNNLSISELQVNSTETPGTCLYSFRQF
uniref:Uncharacterized protein n=1 Tax=Medicago truncatula TaxID=3880 RepID=I3SHR2_MEDTR|nr:unknown [Medicago truncatula]